MPSDIPLLALPEASCQIALLRAELEQLRQFQRLHEQRLDLLDAASVTRAQLEDDADAVMSPKLKLQSHVESLRSFVLEIADHCGAVDAQSQYWSRVGHFYHQGLVLLSDIDKAWAARIDQRPVEDAPTDATFPPLFEH